MFLFCDCGEFQTVRHIVESCPLRKYAGGVIGIYLGESATIEWLNDLVIRL